MRWLDPDETLRRQPLLKPEAAGGGAIFEPEADDMDVAAIHGGFLRGARAAGAVLRLDAEITTLERKDGPWRIGLRDGESLAARTVVNAAGAWADVVAGLAGAGPVGLVPKRRTAFTFDAPAGLDLVHLPMVIDFDESWYFKPEVGQFLASPADETPSPPCDAQPEEIDIAIAVERIETATTLQIRRIKNKWAGLRSFVADKNLVVGYDPAVEGLFWLAGQGGYGIQTGEVRRAARGEPGAGPRHARRYCWLGRERGGSFAGPLHAAVIESSRFIAGTGFPAIGARSHACARGVSPLGILLGETNDQEKPHRHSDRDLRRRLVRQRRARRRREVQRRQFVQGHERLQDRFVVLQGPERLQGPGLDRDHRCRELHRAGRQGRAVGSAIHRRVRKGVARPRVIAANRGALFICVDRAHGRRELHGPGRQGPVGFQQAKRVRAPRWLAAPDPFGLAILSYLVGQGTPTYFCSATE